MTPLAPNALPAAPHPPRGRALQLSLSMLLSAASSAPYALGVFLPAVTASHPRLATVWPSATGLSVLLCAPIMVSTGLLFTRFAASRARVARNLALAAAAGFALFALAGPAIATGHSVALAACVAALGVPLGVLTLLTLEHALAWLPGRPGSAVALSSLSFNLGTVALSLLFARLQQVFALEYALSIAALLLASCGLLYHQLLSFPPPFDSACAGAPPASLDDECAPLLGALSKPPRLSARDALLCPHFWLYVVCALTVGAAFALIPYFFRIGALFGAERAALDRAFAAGGLAGIPVAPVVAALAPQLRSTRALGGMVRVGARNVWVGVLLAQAAACMRLAALSGGGGEFAEFATLAAFLRACYMVQNGLAALLAREVFGAENTAFVYGVGAGLALGTGEAASVAVMAAVERAVGGFTSVRQCVPFYFAVGGWCVIVIALMMMIRRRSGSKYVSRTVLDVR